MESWITVVVAAIVALSTLGGAFLQNWFSHKRFKAELGRTIDVENRKRRWEVRSEPLFKLRAELASMATKLNILINEAQIQNDSENVANNEKERELQSILGDWQKYGISGDFLQTVYLQFDAELLNLVESIRETYLFLFEYALDWRQLKTEEFRSFRENLQKTKTKILEIQGLINKRLVEL